MFFNNCVPFQGSRLIAITVQGAQWAQIEVLGLQLENCILICQVNIHIPTHFYYITDTYAEVWSRK